MKLTGDDKVRATGPFIEDEGFELKRLSFMLSQKDVMVKGEGAARRRRELARRDRAAGLKAEEYVYAVGVAMLAHDAWPPVVQTFTWCEQVEVTGP